MLSKLKLTSFKDYLELADADPGEFTIMVDSLTTNLTTFFREQSHFDFLHDEVYPAIKRDKASVIRFWSAGCSSGEEPYSLAISLKEYFPDLSIDFLAGEWAKSILDAHPSIDEVIVFNAPWILTDLQTPNLTSQQKFTTMGMHLRKNQYDAVLCMSPDFRANLMAALSGAPVRLGFGTAGGSFLLTFSR